MNITPCPPTLLVDSGLVVPNDYELQEPGCRASNKHLRVFVAAWMLGEGRSENEAIQAARALYSDLGRDIEAPGRLSQRDIEAEVFELVDMLERVGEKSAQGQVGPAVQD